MIISKALANQIAIQLTETKKEELEQIKKSLSLFIESKYIENIPKKVMDLFNSNKDYVNKIRVIYITGVGLVKYDNIIRLSQLWPAQGDVNEFRLTDQESIEYLKHKNKIEDLEKSYKELVKEIEQALLSLRTYNNIKENFPEAYALIPAKQNKNQALMIPVDQIRKKLKK